MAEARKLREAVNSVLSRRKFVLQSFKIYRGVAGLFDYGPPGCAVKVNVLNLWRQHFLEAEENMLEVECTAITPEEVLKASGHVEKFTDVMVKDVKLGTCFRADHLVKDFINEALEKDARMPEAKREEYEQTLATLDGLTMDDLGEKIKSFGIKSPATMNDLSDPFPFNLMFATQIGPTGTFQGYLRPETAQGMFVNFNELLEYNAGKLPFGAIQIGPAFRNEISPRQGLLRVREFTLAEIEYFVDPLNKLHPKFKSVADLEFLLLPRDLTSARQFRLGDAVQKGIINNETLGYFIGRTYLFLTALGIKKDRLRFRQHLANEMAHYAADCWDAEIECSYGWIECVGLADRSAYDLEAHTKASKVKLSASRNLPEEIEVEELKPVPNKKEIGLAFKADQKLVLKALEDLSIEDASELEAKLESDGEAELRTCDKTFSIKKSMTTFTRQTVKKNKQSFIPSVIEPSFGIGRIIYCLFEHCYEVRKDPKDPTEEFNVFRFPPAVAPVKCVVFPLIQNQELNNVAGEISVSLRRAGVSNNLDITGRSIGKRYARNDEIGVPFAVTVDFDEAGVTVRDRDSKEQIRVPVEEVTELIVGLSAQTQTWAEAKAVYAAV